MSPCGQPSLAPSGQPCAGDQTRSCGGIPVGWSCHGPLQHHIIFRQARCQISSPAGEGTEEMVLSPVCAPVGGSALRLHSTSCSEMRLSLPSSWATGWPLSRVSCTGKTFSSCSMGCWVSGFSPGSPASICTGAGVRGRQLQSPALHPRLSRSSCYAHMQARVWVPPKCSALASSILRLPQPLPCPSQAAQFSPHPSCTATPQPLLCAGTSPAVPRRDPNPPTHCWRGLWLYSPPLAPVSWNLDGKRDRKGNVQGEMLLPCRELPRAHVGSGWHHRSHSSHCVCCHCRAGQAGGHSRSQNGLVGHQCCPPRVGPAQAAAVPTHLLPKTDQGSANPVLVMSPKGLPHSQQSWLSTLWPLQPRFSLPQPRQQLMCFSLSPLRTRQ